MNKSPLHVGVIEDSETGKHIAAVVAEEHGELLRAAPKLLTALQAVEWVDVEKGICLRQPIRLCPCCLNERTEGHTANCTTAAALKAAGVEVTPQ